MSRAILLALLAAAYAATGLAVVGPGERAVVRRFGRVVARPGPGLWVGRPWGFETVDRVAVSTARQVTVGADDPAGVTLLTGDENRGSVRLVVEYTAGPADADLDDYLASRAVADDRLAGHAEALAAEWVAARPVDRVLLTGHAGLAGWVRGGLPALAAADRLGVAVQRVSVDALAAPAEVRDSFDAVTQAQTAGRTAENLARQEAGRRVKAAEMAADRLAQQAAAYRAEQLSAAAAEAGAFAARLAAFRAAGGTTDALAAIWWDEIGRTLAALKTRGRVDVLDHHIGPTGLDVTQFLPPPK